MKKVTLFAVVAMAVLSLASCKKDRTCTCTITSSLGGGSSTTTSVMTKVSKKTGQANCVSGTYENVPSGYSGTVDVETRSCTLK